MRRTPWLLLLGACAPSGESASEPTPGPVWFVEQAAQRGIAFTHRSGAAGERLMPEIMGGGAALFDADGDGDLDAYLVQGGSLRAAPSDRPPNQLFSNDGAGHFTDVTRQSGAGDRGYGMGALAGDWDGDGHRALFDSN